MFDLSIFIRKKIEGMGFNKDGSLTNMIANDTSKYIASRGGVFTPEALESINSQHQTQLNDGLYLICDRNNIEVGKGETERIKIEHERGRLEKATFYSEIEDGGLVYGVYVPASSKVGVRYYNAESTRFAEGLLPKDDDNQVEHIDAMLNVLLDERNAITPDDGTTYKATPQNGLATILDAAINEYSKSRNSSR